MTRVVYGLGVCAMEGLIPIGELVPFERTLEDLRTIHIPALCMSPSNTRNRRKLAACVLLVAITGALSNHADAWFAQAKVQVDGIEGCILVHSWRGAQVRKRFGWLSDPRTTYADVNDEVLAAVLGLDPDLCDVLEVLSTEARLHCHEEHWNVIREGIPDDVWEEIRADPAAWRPILNKWIEDVFPELDPDAFCFASGEWVAVAAAAVDSEQPELATNGPEVHVFEPREEAQNEWHAVCSAVHVARTLGFDGYDGWQIAGCVSIGGAYTRGVVGDHPFALSCGLSALQRKLGDQPDTASVLAIADDLQVTLSRAISPE